MKRLFTLTLVAAIAAATLQLSAPTAKADPVCTTAEITQCYAFCNMSTPGSCVLESSSCVYYGGPICVCDMWCLYPAHVGPNTIPGGFRHLEVRLGDDIPAY